MNTGDNRSADQVNHGLRDEIVELRVRLVEAEDALSAIRGGQVDAIVVEAPQGTQVFSLSGAETVYRLAVETMAEAALNVTPDGQILFCNERFAEFVRTPAHRLLGRNLEQFIEPELGESVHALLDGCLQGPIQQRVVFRAADGTLTATHLSGRALHPGEDTSLCLVATDLTELERSAVQIAQLREAQSALEQSNAALRESEEKSRRNNRALRALSRSSQAMLQATDKSSYMDEVCRIIVEDCGHPLVWIGFEEIDKAQSVRPVAYSGFEEDYLETLRITWADTERGRGPTGTAIRTGQPAFCRDMQTDPQFAPWRDEAIRRGYAASLALPLMEGKRAFGALTIYFREPNPFAEEEVKLLKELADDLAHGITSLRLRREREEAETALRASLREKEVLLHEVHHRVKNNLQVISSLVSLQVGSLTGQERVVFGNVQDQVRAMALVHEKLYQAGNFERIEFAEYANDLLVQLWRAYGEAASRADLTLHLQPVTLPLTTAVPCGLLLNELAGNALKHAFRERPQGGQVTVSLAGEPEGRICLRVADNGAGLPPGLDWRNCPSLGLRLVQMLTRQVGGTVEARCPIGGGVEFVVQFLSTGELITLP